MVLTPTVRGSPIPLLSPTLQGLLYDSGWPRDLMSYATYPSPRGRRSSPVHKIAYVHDITEPVASPLATYTLG